MALSNRNTVLAITEEVTEGTPVSPTSGANYVALQEGFTMEPAFTELTNDELNSSIGRAKPIIGSEEPTASINHYLRHSGVEATAPNYSLLLKSFFGTLVPASAEFDTIAASTVSLVKVDVGEGVNFQRGKALLVKKTTGVGYEIRNVLSVSGDDLTLAQNLKDAPGTGVNLGRAVLYKPANTGHPTLSNWLYRGNAADGAVELMAGTRVTEMGVEIAANELINASFTLAGVEYFFDPIEITATTNKMDFNDGSDKNVSVTAKMYKDPYELASALQTAMDAASSDTITVTYSDVTGKYTIATNGATLNLEWNTGANAAQTIGTKLGFLVAADDTGSLTYTSDNAVSKASPFTPTFDSSDPLVAKDNQVLLSSNSTETTCFSAQSVTVNGSLEKKDIASVCATSGKSGSIINAREITIDIVSTLEAHQAEEFKDFRQGNKILFTYNGGVKVGGNWVPGKCINIHTPQATITSFNLGDDEGLITLEMTLTCYVQSGLDEFYLNFL